MSIWTNVLGFRARLGAVTADSSVLDFAEGFVAADSCVNECSRP